MYVYIVVFIKNKKTPKGVYAGWVVFGRKFLCNLIVFKKLISNSGGQVTQPNLFITRCDSFGLYKILACLRARLLLFSRDNEDCFSCNKSEHVL